MIRGVIFDLDGVLVSTDEFHYRGWQRLADEECVYFDREINHRLRGVSRMQSLAILLERSHRAYSDEEKVRLAERKNAYYRESLKRLTPADTLPGAREMLAELRRRGIQTAVASSSKNTPLIMKQCGLAGAVDAVADGNDITHSKPHPEVFLIAAARLALPPADCLVVEDAGAGVEAGLNAGMKVLGVGFAAEDPRAHARAKDLAAITVEEVLAI